MRVLQTSALALIFLAFAHPVFGQSTDTSSQSAPENAPSDEAPPQGEPGARVRHRSYEVPCWRQAGLTADMVNKRWKLEDQAKAQIAGACNETSTSAQQKHDKIEAINADRDRAIAKLIPAKELEAFNACEANWQKTHPKPKGEKVLGPCGGTIPADAESMPGMDHSGHH
jgi:hypothetical protein